MNRGPNIVFIMTDHTNGDAVSPQSGCQTPNLDLLAADGARFGRCYTTNAICSPARASLMTGLFPSTHGMWDCTHTQRAEWVDVPAGRFRFFSEHLKEAGYSNGYFGKWHVEQSNRLEDFGWDEYDCSCQGARGTPIPDTEVIVPKTGYRDYLLAAASADSETSSHPAFDRGIEFIGRAAAKDGPFCCFISTIEPHDPYIAPQRFLDLYDTSTIDVSPTLRTEPAGKPEVIRRMREVWNGLTDRQWRMVMASYRAVVSFLDHEVGRIVDSLKSLGLYEDTVIVFTSDHGDMMGGHGLVTKGVGTSYEEVYRIPLVMRVPGSRALGEVRDPVVSLVDLGPTLLDLCGAAPLPGAHGRSFRSLLEGGAADGWTDAYGEFFGQRFVYTQRITWHRNWKYVFSPGGIDELYDLEADPRETVNLAADPEHRGVLEDMAKRMWRKMEEIGDESLFNTNYATLRTAPVGPEARQLPTGSP